ncbi:hypothetical protein [Herbidospora daliensis]|uniref:hypothetical protein n=1 Tax=Herbidospora daliensis TaxID=295585 RepID=UPI0007810E7F|nr:hypothetical protein [Herbidospora daliensis]
MTAVTHRPDFLRLALLGDAVVTGGNGLAYLLFAAPLGSLLGPEAGLLRGIGAFLVVYALAVGLLSTRRPISRPATLAVITLNLLWSLGSVAAVVAWSFTTVGALWAVAQAVVVAAFAALQVIGLRRS